MLGGGEGGGKGKVWGEIGGRLGNECGCDYMIEWIMNSREFLLFSFQKKEKKWEGSEISEGIDSFR